MSDTPINLDSTLFGISIRAWIATLLTSAVCLICLADTWSAIYIGIKTNSSPAVEVKEPLYSMFVAAISFYFGQQTKRL